MPGGSLEPKEPMRKGKMRMIAGEPIGGDSYNARKAQVREAHDMTVKDVLDVEDLENTPPIQFERAE
ncbi:UNVERIFIED_CONTAM: hypothetical protein Sangu_3155700 [Sesamum angustifolium]|uniref:Uncharacterized protein n=1 Tax=Sesamum angustifolium TaxID=2727405 RepID=A0AAW2JUA4_9LAMI